MPDDTFSSALSYVLVNEGSTYTNAAADAGGPTKYGVCLATLTQWRAAAGRATPTADDVKNLGLAEVGEIYRQQYWQAIGAGLMTDGNVATALFDASVLCGVDWVRKGVQNIVNALTQAQLKVDGVLGPKSLAALNGCERRPFLVAFVALQQTRFLDIVTRNATQRIFHKTWQKRTACYLDLNF